MNPEESLFKFAWKFFGRAGAKWRDPGRAARVVRLRDERERLVILARALSGRPVEILAVEREQEGGWSGDRFYLPVECDRFADQDRNRFFYVFRVAYLNAQRELGLNWATPAQAADTARSRMRACETAPLVLARLGQDFPALAEQIPAMIAAAASARDEKSQLLWGRWLGPAQAMDARDGHGPASLDGDENQERADRVTTEVEREIAPETPVVIQKPERAAEDYTLMHSFEKIETVDDFNGNWRDLDGSDELEEQREALEDLNPHVLLRADDPAHSVFRLDLGGGGAPDVTDGPVGGGVLYDEWNWKRRAYRQNFCALYPEAVRAQSPDYTRRVLRERARDLRKLRKHFFRVFNEPVVLRRLYAGDDPDLDALVERRADLRARRPGTERVFMSRRTRSRDLALRILVDTSLSTDGFTAGRRILDAEKESLLLFGEILHEAGISFAVDGFSSRTRNNCRYLYIKSNREAWPATRDRIAALRPEGYTRIGPAIRHATALLAKTPGRRKWLLLLSDGKPNDYDRYEGKHGIEDVKQTIREAGRAGIRLFCLAMDPRAREHLPRMIGPGHFRILHDPSALPGVMLDFFLRILQR